MPPPIGTMPSTLPERETHMPTKAELESQIEELKAQVGKQSEVSKTLETPLPQEKVASVELTEAQIKYKSLMEKYRLQNPVKYASKMNTIVDKATGETDFQRKLRTVRIELDEHGNEKFVFN